MYIPRFHALDFNAKYRVKRVQAYKLLHKHPIWVDQPSTMQFDTQNICNLQCKYCNPQGTYVKEHGQLPLSVIEQVLKQVHDYGWFINRVSPFMNGEPLLEKRLSLIMSLIKKYTGARIGLYTNGTVTSNREVLLDKNVDLVNFTLSATTPETYFKVTRHNLYDEATKNIEWFSKNKRLNQRLRMVFVLCKENMHELSEWRRKYKNYDQAVRPVHDAEDVKPQSRQAEDGLSFEELHKLSSLEIYPLNKHYELDAPCSAWGALSINYKGEIMQCMDLPYELNFGNIADVNIKEVWHKRLDQGLNCKGCRECKMKNPDWKVIFEKYVWN
jgi:MoaA/NifB/PqqE/SkfB family radical SAM enzyme